MRAATVLLAAAAMLPPVAPRPRVALLLCGHMRTYRSTAPSVRQRVLLSAERAGLDIDVFVSTWVTGAAGESAAEISSAYGTSPRTNHSFLQEQHVLLLQERHEAVRMKVVLDGVRMAARDGRVFGST